MSRYSKGFRTFGGICILLNLAAFFLPLTERVQKNYATLRWSEWNYLQSLLEQQLPSGTDRTFSASGMQITWILLLMILPLLLSLIAGIWGIVGGHRQKVSSLLAFVVLALYIGMSICISYVWPEAGSGQSYCRGYAYLVHLAASGCASVAAILALVSTPKEIRAADAKAGNIPQVQEIRQQQIEAKYNIITDEGRKEAPEQDVVKPYVPGSEPRGVMVFLKGMYAGVEIPFNGNDFILLGRSNNNHLIFENQPRISRNHCKIRWDSQRKTFVFLDYSSTGSFVNGSTDCLPQNLELDIPPGTVVAIGDESNVFRLE